MCRLSLDTIMNAIESDAYIGFCAECGYKHYGVEPDARKYTCNHCGQCTVYGAEELLIMGVGI